MHRRDAPRSGQLTVSACLRWQMTPPNNHRSFYAHDLWNIKYLHKFKWSHLTEKIAYEARVLRDKMQAELTQAKKESSFYLRKVDQAKAIESMEERNQKKREQAQADAGKKRKRAPADEAGGSEAEGLQSVRRNFKQRKVAKDTLSAGTAKRAVLGSLFGSGGASPS